MAWITSKEILIKFLNNNNHLVDLFSVQRSRDQLIVANRNLQRSAIHRQALVADNGLGPLL